VSTHDWIPLIAAALRRDVAEAHRLAVRWGRAASKRGDEKEIALAGYYRAEADQVAGRIRESAAGYRAARGNLETLGEARLALVVRLSALQVHALLGESKRFRSELRALRRALDSGPARALVEQAAGNGWRALANEAQAEECFRAALRVLARRRDPRAVAARAHVRQDLGVALAFRGAPRPALRELQRARDTLESLGLEHSVAMCDANIAWARGVAGEFRDAWEGLRDAASKLAAAGDARRAALARVDGAEVRLRLGDAERAAAEAATEARWLSRAGLAFESARAWLLVARAQRQHGFGGRARTAARRAETLLASIGEKGHAALASQYAGGSGRRAPRRLRDAGHWCAALDASLDVADELKGSSGAAWLDREARAFPPVLRRWLQPARLRLSAAAEPERRIPLLRRAVREAEKLRALAPTTSFRATSLAQHLALYEELAAALLARGRKRDVLERAAPRLLDTARVRRLRERIEGLWRAIEERERDPRDLRGGATPLLREVRAQEGELVRLLVEEPASSHALPPGQGGDADACLAFAAIGKRLVGFLSDARGVTTWDAGPLARLRGDVSALRFQVERCHYGAQDSAAIDSVLARISARVLGPVDSLPRSLRVVLPVEMGTIPVEALFWRGAPLIEHADVEYAPCAAWRARPWRTDGGSLVIGLPGDALPEIESEVRAVAGMLPRARRMSGEAASRERILDTLAGRRVVHVAGHAAPRDDLPPLSALRVHDGWLTASDLGGASLRGALVVLSACRTGDPAMDWQGEALAGFPRAILAAGAGGVVASRWPVRDEPAREWMERFYRGLRRSTPRDAAARATRELRAQRPHPADWAAFLLVRGGSR
jgi:hypothetical protein